MNAVESDEVLKYRTLRNRTRAGVLVALLAVLAAIGINAPPRPMHMSINCVDPSVMATMSDASPDRDGACGTGKEAKAPEATSRVTPETPTEPGAIPSTF